MFFGPWETYFLKAEAALRGWNVGTSAENAYNNGIKASFEYHGLGSLYDSYIVSEGYNRVGTSVKWSHTTEPQSTEMDFMDGYTKTMGKMTYNYPNPNNILYPGKKLNDGLTKIITQLYIANASLAASGELVEPPSSWLAVLRNPRLFQVAGEYAGLVGRFLHQTADYRPLCAAPALSRQLAQC